MLEVVESSSILGSGMPGRPTFDPDDPPFESDDAPDIPDDDEEDRPSPPV
jgi:hypothetical protein